MIELLSLFTNYNFCLFCGCRLNQTLDSNIIKFCSECCSSILKINGQLNNIKLLFDCPQKSKNVLKKRFNISSRKDFKEWAIYNHPDKGGDDQIFLKVMKLVNIKYPK